MVKRVTFTPKEKYESVKRILNGESRLESLNYLSK